MPLFLYFHICIFIFLSADFTLLYKYFNFHIVCFIIFCFIKNFKFNRYPVYLLNLGGYGILLEIQIKTQILRFGLIFNFYLI